MLVSNRCYEDSNISGLIAAAVVWQARTSPAGALVGKSQKFIHYEITDTGPAAPPGSGAHNFRLLLGQNADDLNANVATRQGIIDE
jgi:hypothetical protein